jgi:hypothetical protein
MAGARSAVIHPYASGRAVPSSSWFKAAIRALVIMPRSPTMTILASPNFSRTG